MSVSLPLETVTVAIPAYNAAQWLSRCIESVLAQTWSKLEVLLLDDGSMDATRSIAADYAVRDSRIRLLSGAHRGVSAARNLCLRQATGAWLTFVDADDWLPNDAVSRLMRLAADTKADFCAAGYSLCRSGRVSNVRVSPVILQEREQMHRYFLTKGRTHCFPWAKLYSRNIYSALSYPEGKIYEDIRILPQVIEHANKLAVENVPVYNYCLHPGSITAQKNLEQYLQALDARLETAAFIRARYPKLTPCLGDYLAEISLYVLGKAAHGPAEDRQKVEERVKSALKGISVRSPVCFAATAMIHVSPRITGRLCACYSRRKNGF